MRKRTNLYNEVTDIMTIIREGGVLLTTTDGGRLQHSVGRRYTACEKPAYSYWFGNRFCVYKSALHAAQRFVREIGTRNALATIATWREENQKAGK